MDFLLADLVSLIFCSFSWAGGQGASISQSGTCVRVNGKVIRTWNYLKQKPDFLHDLQYDVEGDLALQVHWPISQHLMQVLMTISVEERRVELDNCCVHLNNPSETDLASLLKEILHKKIMIEDNCNRRGRQFFHGKHMTATGHLLVVRQWQGSFTNKNIVKGKCRFWRISESCLGNSRLI